MQTEAFWGEVGMYKHNKILSYQVFRINCTFEEKNKIKQQQQQQQDDTGFNSYLNCLYTTKLLLKCILFQKAVMRALKVQTVEVEEGEKGILGCRPR